MMGIQYRRVTTDSGREFWARFIGGMSYVIVDEEGEFEDSPTYVPPATIRKLREAKMTSGKLEVVK